MDNYKIKVNDEAESKEAQELFFELGFEWNGSGENVVSWRLGILFTNEFQGKNCLCYFDKDEEVMLDGWVGRELTLPQLRDLVVLHRNDVKDATHTDGETKGFLSSDGVEYFWNAYDSEWFKAKQMTFAYEKFKPINEQGLISGADALRALIDNLFVEITDDELGMDWTEICIKDGDFKGKVEPCLWMFLNQPEHIKFRLKPRTIKLSLEIPAPFEPKDGELVFVLDNSAKEGFTSFNFDGDFYSINFGAWRTEEEIKQVVAAIRGIKG